MTDPMIRAVRVASPGDASHLQLTTMAPPVPGPGQVRVRNAAIGMNFIDVYHRTGLYPLPFPTGLGMEGAGLVDAVGDDVTRFQVGDRIAYANGPPGAYAEAHVVHADRAVLVPDDIPLETAAAAMLKGMTAEYLVRRVFHVKHGDQILVTAAAGGVGLILSQWAQALGANVIGCAGTPAKAEIARAHGCSHVILYHQEDIPTQVRELTNGTGVAVAYDSVGKATWEASMASLRRRGLLVLFGNASGPVPPIDPLALSRGGSLYVTRPTLFDYTSTEEELDASATALFDVIRSGQVKIEIGQRFALNDIQAAHEALEGRQTTGSTLVVP
jgi:NADPH:quinone reductase and related Zn-dependent oxidoreductases